MQSSDYKFIFSPLFHTVDVKFHCNCSANSGPEWVFAVAFPEGSSVSCRMKGKYLELSCDEKGFIFFWHSAKVWIVKIEVRGTVLRGGNKNYRII